MVALMLRNMPDCKTMKGLIRRMEMQADAVLIVAMIAWIGFLIAVLVR